MELTTTDWQSWAAPAVVVLTALIFAVRIFLRSRKPGSPGCGSGCGCGKPKLADKPSIDSR